MPKALVIDDNRQTADTLCQMLNMLQVAAIPTYSSRGAMLLLNEIVPDIIFADLNMPGVSGFEVIGYVHRDPRLYGIPVVVVTSDDQAETAQRVRNEGAFALLIKPATMEMIEKVLKKAKIIK